MFARFHERFGTAGMIVAVIALIAALGGTAIAAGGLTGAEEKLIKKEAKKWGKKFAKRGPQGLPGANGAVGSVGPEGPEGPQGEPGEPGEEGSPWTAGGTLPPGESETGSWVTGQSTEGFNDTASFTIPLAAPLPEAQVKYVPSAGPSQAVCDDSIGADPSAANPEADPGYLCVFGGFESPAGATILKLSAFEVGADTSGALIAAASFSLGTWAVTGCGGTEFPCP